MKPEPDNEIPQAQSAHDTLWDFVALQPETLHTIMWLMSDRALPRSYRMMSGFGVHTFRFVNAAGDGTFVKFHWTPKLGVHSLLWDECQKVAGKDPDFNRRDLWDAIEAGHFPEWELGVQLIPESDEMAFDFDLLDATKLVPEEQVPVRPVGRMTLNRNPENFFAETEQVAFCTANVVPGIDFTNDPLLQFRNFSYLDTQLIRLGGPNFAQLPVNRPVAPVHTNQHDGYSQHTIPVGKTSYHKNSLGGGCPALADTDVFRHYTQQVDGRKIRKRAAGFENHYSQARMFYQSMTDVEAKHIVAAYAFELGKCEAVDIRRRVVEHLNLIDHGLARDVAGQLGLIAPDEQPLDETVLSPALSQLKQIDTTPGIETRKIAVLAADGVDVVGVERFVAAMRDRGAVAEVLAPVAGGELVGGSGGTLGVDRAVTTVASVLYDAVVVPGGPDAVRALSADGYAMHFVVEAYKHLKTIGAFGSGIGLLQQAGIDDESATDTAVTVSAGVVTTTAAAEELGEQFFEAFAAELARHRAWSRETAAVRA